MLYSASLFRLYSWLWPVSYSGCRRERKKNILIILLIATTRKLKPPYFLCFGLLLRSGYYIQVITIMPQLQFWGLYEHYLSLLPPVTGFQQNWIKYWGKPGKEVILMFNKMRLLLLSNLAVFLISIAHFGIGTRCLFIAYEPDIPASLKS